MTLLVFATANFLVFAVRLDCLRQVSSISFFAFIPFLCLVMRKVTIDLEGYELEHSDPCCYTGAVPLVMMLRLFWMAWVASWVTTVGWVDICANFGHSLLLTHFVLRNSFSDTLSR